MRTGKLKKPESQQLMEQANQRFSKDYTFQPNTQRQPEI